MMVFLLDQNLFHFDPHPLSLNKAQEQQIRLGRFSPTGSERTRNLLKLRSLPLSSAQVSPSLCIPLDPRLRVAALLQLHLVTPLRGFLGESLRALP